MEQEEKYMWAIVDGVKEKVSVYFASEFDTSPVFVIHCFLLCNMLVKSSHLDASLWLVDFLTYVLVHFLCIYFPVCSA